MRKAVLLQLEITLITAVVASVFLGARGFFSAMCGGLSYALPSVFFAWRLSVASGHGEHAKVAAFVAGELLKFVTVAVLFALAVALYKDVHWGAFLAGLVLALKANLFAFLVKTRT
jgi:ATP synthase protein I